MAEFTLYNGDCLQVMRGMDADSVDAVIMDPPYYKVKNEEWDRQWETAQGFLDWFDTVLIECYRLLRANGSLYVFASPQMSARVEVLISGRFNVLNSIVWRKAAASFAEKYGPENFRQYVQMSERIIFAEHHNSDSIAKGESGYAVQCDELRGFVFEPLRAYLDGERKRAGVDRVQVDQFLGNFMSSHYFSNSQWTLPTEENYQKLRQCLSTLNHSGQYLRREYEDLRREYEDLRREYEDLRRPFAVTADVPYTDVWTFKTVNAYPSKHPTEKPIDLMSHIVKASTRPGAVILDPFAGSGSTGVAALMAKRQFIGIEKDSGYFEIMKQRISQSRGEFPTITAKANDLTDLPLFAEATP